MPRLLLILLFLSAGCQSLSEQEKLRRDISGEWIVLLADHSLKNEDQRQIYGRIQDSIIGAKALKLVTFEDDGNFQQIDEPDLKGKWAVSPDKQLYIANGGKGFVDFKADFSKYEKKRLEVIEYLDVKGEKIKLTWYLKKINTPWLFDPQKNAWRKKATRIESEAEIRERLAAMFRYYSDYFELVSKESSFFISSRVMLPLRFYQHAMGTIAFDPKSDFANLFFNNEQAGQAHGYVKRMVYDLGNKYPTGDNFVHEYAMFMESVGEGIAKSIK